jgi:hypothetical protein
MTSFARAAEPLAIFFASHPAVATWTTYIVLGGKALNGLIDTVSTLGTAAKGAFDLLWRGVRRATFSLSARRTSQDSQNHFNHPEQLLPEIYYRRTEKMVYI